jgi:hypothetical protein
MVLKRGEIVGYDYARMMFEFTMRYGERVVRCEISSVALNDLAGRGSIERTPQLVECRQQIESTAFEVLPKTRPAGAGIFRGYEVLPKTRPAGAGIFRG